MINNDNFLWTTITNPKKVIPNEPSKSLERIVISRTRGFKLELDLKLIRARKNTREKHVKHSDLISHKNTSEITGQKFQLSKKVRDLMKRRLDQGDVVEIFDKKYEKIFSPQLLSPIENERVAMPHNHDKEGKIKQQSNFAERLEKFKRKEVQPKQSRQLRDFLIGTGNNIVAT